ncbi:MAG: RNA chaperone Hfq [Candidatus Korobacteraceae bacterium]
MRNGPDSTAVVRALEPENFGNRKLIRPSLNREQARAAEAAEPRERGARSTERSLERNGERGVERSQERNHDRNQERNSERAPGNSRKAAPAEQTHAENFYYQKQIQGKTPMVVVTRDGEQLRGIIEWYDKNCIKLNRPAGQSNLMIYKSAIRYMYKEGEENK